MTRADGRSGIGWALGLLVVVLGAFPCAGAVPQQDFLSLAFDQHPGRTLPPGGRFIDEAGHELTLAEHLNGAPGILVLEYLRCPNLCGLVLGGLAEALREARNADSAPYRVLAVSIDPAETRADAAASRADYASRFGRDTMESWRFLTAPEADIRQLATTIGFPMRWDDALGQWAHPAGAVVITPDGAVSRYLLGVEFDAVAVRLALAEASRGVIAGPAASLLLLCYGYDPKTGRYTLAIMTVLRAAGLATCLLGAGLLLWALRRERRVGA